MLDQSPQNQNQHGRWAAWIQMPTASGELYPPAAAALGVPLWRLLVLQVVEVNTAMRAAEALLRGGAARLVAMDMGADAKPLRLSTYHRLRHQVMDSGAALVFLSPHSIVPADYRIDLNQSREATGSLSAQALRMVRA
ncbi:MAG: hypothetical protein ACI9WU_004583 [Myxococcota bacterium]|jgi:hypothetical protein